MPRKRKQTARYGNDDSIVNMSDLETSDSDEDDDGKGGKGKKSRKSRRNKDDDVDFDGTPEGFYSRSECFKVEKNLLIYG